MSLVFLSGITGMIPEPARSSEHHTADNSSEADPWEEYHAIVYSEYADAFTALYEGYETRWAKNGRLMLRNGDTGPYKFVKRAV
ncbi:hypothetical protein [Streptomyces sp. NPDC006355]|uniref:hypothetical protein n=1 Tax=Streptomyces sp. NPDC006355 TaxID=3156758 RepID=UPI0033AE4E5D